MTPTLPIEVMVSHRDIGKSGMTIVLHSGKKQTLYRATPSTNLSEAIFGNCTDRHNIA
jgi:hypothetical protein